MKIDDEWLGEVHFGTVESETGEAPAVEDEGPDDDEELDETPADVVALLGFDPLEELSRGETADEWNEADHPRAPDGKFGNGAGGAAPSSPESGGGGAAPSKRTSLQTWILNDLAKAKKGALGWPTAERNAKALKPLVERGLVTVENGKASITEKGRAELRGEAPKVDEPKVEPKVELPKKPEDFEGALIAKRGELRAKIRQLIDQQDNLLNALATASGARRQILESDYRKITAEKHQLQQLVQAINSQLENKDPPKVELPKPPTPAKPRTALQNLILSKLSTSKGGLTWPLAERNKKGLQPLVDQGLVEIDSAGKARITHNGHAALLNNPPPPKVEKPAVEKPGDLGPVKAKEGGNTKQFLAPEVYAEKMLEGSKPRDIKLSPRAQVDVGHMVPTYFQATKDGLSKMPASHLDALKDTKVSVVEHCGPPYEWAAGLHTSRPYFPSTIQVAMGYKPQGSDRYHTINLDYVRHVALHEAGHGIDQVGAVFGDNTKQRLSTQLSRELNSVAAQMKAGIYGDRSKYWTASPSEMFAEYYAFRNDPTQKTAFGGISRERVEEYFAGVSEKIDKAIEKRIASFHDPVAAQQKSFMALARESREKARLAKERREAKRKAA